MTNLERNKYIAELHNYEYRVDEKNEFVFLKSEEGLEFFKDWAGDISDAFELFQDFTEGNKRIIKFDGGQWRCDLGSKITKYADTAQVAICKAWIAFQHCEHLND